MQIFDSLPIDAVPFLRDYVYRAGWFLVLFLLGLLGRIAVAWLSKVSSYHDRITRIEITCAERRGKCKRRK